MAQVSCMGEWEPLPSDIADWMGSVQEPDVLGRTADAAPATETVQARGLRERLLRMLVAEKRAC